MFYIICTVSYLFHHVPLYKHDLITTVNELMCMYQIKYVLLD